LLTGAKAAALARVGGAGLPVLPGFVITTHLARSILDAGGVAGLPDETRGELHDAWKVMSNAGAAKLVVRSSSTAEDNADSSMAGMFSSVLDVQSWEDFCAAVEHVLDSRKVIDLGRGTAAGAPIAVLVQPQLAAERGGVMFGVDPLTGDPSHLTVVAVAGGPDELVSGKVTGEHYLLSRSGRLIHRDPTGPRLLSSRDRHSLARLAGRAADHFGGPQDIEWGRGADGKIYLFQSRPVTAIAAPPVGPILGPGPIAETFPNPLTELEIDLWIAPLREAIEHSLLFTGAASRRRIRTSPVVATVGGRVAADLELLGIAPVRKRFEKLNPLPPARRLAAAWRVGRLRAALPSLARALTEQIDERLTHVPDVRELTNEQLVIALERTQRALVSLHGFEMLAGTLGESDGGTGAAVALRALALARSEGFSSEQVAADHPEVLALAPPAIKARLELPAGTSMDLACDAPDHALGPREALRLRVRWVQELSARAAWELGKRLIAARKLRTADQVAGLRFDELKKVVEGGRIPRDLKRRQAVNGAPLPSAFRMGQDGSVIPVAAGTGDGRGAGGGRGMGKVHQGRTPEHGDVLVVRSLDPGLAPLLPTLGGLVAETGSPLSHLAILAREFGIPTVVALDSATDRFAEGTVILVDGATGEVSEVER
jgi:pyruvate,water dikinase